MEDYKEKYEHALEKSKQLLSCLIDGDSTKNYIIKERLEDAFEELKESEDERVRKWIYTLVNNLGEPADEDAQKELDEMQPLALAWLKKQGEQKLYVNDNAKEMFIKALERVEEQNSKGYKLTDCDKNSWWEDFKAYTSCTIEQKPTDKVEPKWKKGNDGEVLYETSVIWVYNETKTFLATAGLFLDSNTFYLPISELEKLPKEEFEKQGEQKPADKVEPKFKKE